MAAFEDAGRLLPGESRCVAFGTCTPYRCALTAAGGQYDTMTMSYAIRLGSVTVSWPAA